MEQPQAKPRLVSRVPQEEASPQVSARLQDPLLDGALRFFALVAQEEAIAHADATLAVGEQIQGILSAQAAVRIADFFRQLLLVPQIPEEVCAPLRAEASYADRVYILLKVLEFRRNSARGKTPTAISGDLPRQLGISGPDFHVLSAINESREAADSSAVAESTVRILPVTDVDRADRLWLTVTGAHATFLAVERTFYVARRSSHSLRIGKRDLPENVFMRIGEDETVALGGKQINTSDLRYYFRQALRQRQESRLYVQVTKRATVVSWKANPMADFCLTLAGVTPTVEAMDSPRSGDVKLAGQVVTGAVPGWLGDELHCGGRRLQIRRLLACAQIDFFVFTEHVNTCTISNDPQASIYIQDAAARYWTSRFEVLNGKVWMLTGDCPHPTQVGEDIVTGRTRVRVGDNVRVAGVCLQLECTEGVLGIKTWDDRLSSISIEGITHRFANGATALDVLTFEFQRGDLVCVLGPSGCGKSTLLNVLNGTIQPVMGDVKLDGVSLFSNPSLQRSIGFVPQDDLLQENLTVRENLLFAAKLRRPRETAASHAMLVDAALEDIGLREQQHVKIGSALNKLLSGGQRKRVNIGLELVGPGSLLLLDEPTSGLSSGDTRKIIDVLRRRADAGHAVFAVLHQPSARVLEIFDKVLVLDQGGRMAFYGDVQGCYRFFVGALSGPVNAPASAVTSPEPDVIFEALEQPKVRLDGSPDLERRYPSTYWQGRYRSVAHQYLPAPLREDVPPTPSLPPSRKASFLELSRVLLLRECLNKLRGRVGLLLQCVSASLLGAAAALACRVNVSGQYSYRTNGALLNYMFLTVIVCLFLAVSGSVQEIIRDRAILLRERMLNIPFLAYLQSKFVALFLIYACQLTLYLAAGFWILRIPELFGAWWIFLAVVGCAGIGSGLALSSIPKLSERAAAVLVPLVIIPQIILCGADPFPFSKMGHLKLSSAKIASTDENADPPSIAQIMPSRWAFEGLVTLHRDHGFAHAYDYARTALSAEELKFFRKYPSYNADSEHGDSKAYEKRLVQFAHEYAEHYSRPLTQERLALFYLKKSGETNKAQADPNIHPMQEQMADSFNKDTTVQNRFAQAHRIPGTGWLVNATLFDGGILVLFTLVFLGIAAFFHGNLPTWSVIRPSFAGISSKIARRTN